MRVMVVIRRSPAQRYLIDLCNEGLIREITYLINRRRHSQAVVAVLSRGKLARKIDDGEVNEIRADLVLTEESAHWDVA